MLRLIGRSLVLLAFGWAGSASAGLIDLGGAVLDTRSGLLWTQQANLFGNTSVYDPALATIEELNLSLFWGSDAWRFGSSAELLGMYNQKSDVIQLFLGNFSYVFFTNRPPYGDSGTLVEGFNFGDGSSTTMSRYTNDAFTWAVTDEAPVVDPVPATIYLLGLSLAALGFSRQNASRLNALRQRNDNSPAAIDFSPMLRTAIRRKRPLPPPSGH